MRRRKLLVMLLTLALALSFMPMIAFADAEADDASVRETAEEVSGEAEGSDVPEDADEDLQVIKSDALNAQAGSKAASNCAHKNTHTDESRDWDNAKYTSIDDRSHKVSGPVDIETWCDDCGELVKTETVTRTEIEEHPYEDHVCMDCGHKNGCGHPRTYTEYRWDEDDVKYTSVDDMYHIVKGTGELVTYCEECEDEVSSKAATINEKYEHCYENHVCMDCGHKNGCKHANKYTDYEWDDADVKYTSVDKAHHSIKGKGKMVTYCSDCGERISSKTVTIDEEDYHDFDSKNVCRNCGYKNTCKHPSTYYEYEYDAGSSKITDLYEDGHKVSGKITKNTYCRECEALVKTDNLGNTTVTEPHYYDVGDVCAYCGHHWGPKDTRIYGKKRYDTAIAVADRSKDASFVKFDNIVVAYGSNFPDALSGGYLADVKNAPILLVEPSEENRIADYIGKNIASGGKVYILGGTGVVSSGFENKVKAKGIATERLGGKTRYDTNLAILKAAGVKGEDILVCSGNGYADSLSASAVGKPILLVGDTLTSNQKTFLKGLGTKQFYLIGGTGAVKPAVEKDLKGLGSAKIDRLWGKTRYEMSTAVAKKFFAKTSTVMLVYAQNFPDGLSGGPLAMLKGAPIILTDSKTTGAAKAYVKSAGAVRSIILGGPTLISDAAVRAIMGR